MLLETLLSVSSHLADLSRKIMVIILLVNLYFDLLCFNVMDIKRTEIDVINFKKKERELIIT